MLFKYRKRSPLGGLAANLTAEFDESSEATGKSLVLHGGLRLALPAEGLFWEDFAWMAFGAAMHQPCLSERFPHGVVLQVVCFEFPLADYRPQVAALAMDGWLVTQMGCPPSGADVDFDEEAGEYRFRWAGARPFGDQ